MVQSGATSLHLCHKSLHASSSNSAICERAKMQSCLIFSDADERRLSCFFLCISNCVGFLPIGSLGNVPSRPSAELPTGGGGDSPPAPPRISPTEPERKLPPGSTNRTPLVLTTQTIPAVSR